MNLKPCYGKAKAKVKAEVEPIQKKQVEVPIVEVVEEVKPKRNFKHFIEEESKEEE